MPYNEQADTVLYYAAGISSSEEVLMALLESDLPYKLVEVDIYNQEDYEESFLQISESGELPVLVMGDEDTYCGSSDILHFLDKNLAQEPLCKTFTQARLESVRKIIEDIPLSVLTYGCLLYPTVANELRINNYNWMTENEIKLRMKLLDFYTNVREKSKVSSEYVFLKKRKPFLDLLGKIPDERNFRAFLKVLGENLDRLDAILPDLKGDWFGGKHVSVDDIRLTVMLHRLKHLGLFPWVFFDGARPNLELYYEQAKRIPSFNDTFENQFVEDPPSSLISHTVMIFILAAIIFAIISVCSYLKYH